MKCEKTRQKLSVYLLLLILVNFIPRNCSAEEKNTDFQQAMELYKNNDYPQALHKFIQITKNSPQNKDVYFYSGLCYFYLNKYSDARDMFNQLIKNNPDYYQTYYYLGITLIKLKDFKQATENLIKAQQYEPDEEDICYNLGLAYFYQNEYNLSIESLGKALELNPDFVEAYYLLGIIYDTTGYLDYSETYLKTALEVDKEQKFTSEIKKYLEKIRNKSSPNVSKKLYLSLYLSGNSDNNVNSTPGSYYSATDKSDTCYITGISGVLDSLGFVNVSGSAYNYSYKKYTEINTMVLSLGTDARWQISDNIFLSPKYSYNRSYLNNNFFSVYQQIIPRIEYVESTNLVTVFSYEYDIKSYPGENYQYLNGNSTRFYMDQYLYFADRNGYLKLSYNGGTEKSNNLSGKELKYYYYSWNASTTTADIVNVYTDYLYSYSYQAQRISAEIFFPLFKTVSLFLSYSQENRAYLDADLWYTGPSEGWSQDGNIWKKYENNQWVIQPNSNGPAPVKHSKKRIDDEQNLTVNVTKALMNKVYLYLSYSLIVNKSNFTTKDYADRNYNRQIVSMSMQYGF